MHLLIEQEIINHMCDDDDIKAISFVGPNTVSSSFDSMCLDI